MDRRTALLLGAGAAAGGLILGASPLVRGKRRILIRGLWQWENIGDIGHGLGMVQLVRNAMPDAEIVLWCKEPPPEAKGFVERAFKGVHLLGLSDNRGQMIEFHRCDFLIGGSSPGFASSGAARKWTDKTGKPFGVFGMSWSRMDPPTLALLRQAKFIYFRDTPSLEVAKGFGLPEARMGFVPDDVFAYRLKADVPDALAYMAEHGLEPGQYLCCIPRNRFTPRRQYASAAQQTRVVTRNAEMMGPDHAPLIAAITKLVREHGKKVLICPEDVDQVQLGKIAIYDRLPPDARKQVVWRDRYWFTDEAATVFRHSLGVFGNEQHSPIIAIGHGVPGIVCRSAEQSTKGMMWRDLGMSDWLFDLDNADEMRRLPDAVAALAADPAGAKRKALAARGLAARIQAERMRTVVAAIPA